MATYQGLNEEWIKSWEKSGKSCLVQEVKTILESNGNSKLIEDKGYYQVLQLFVDLCRHIVNGKLPEDQATSVLNALNGKEKSNQLASIMVDVLSVLDIETIAEEDKQRREKFITLLSSVKAIVPDWLLKQRLEPETLESAQLLPSQKQFNQKYVKIKTKLYYRQQKFNLLREEGEGYSKLITELGQQIDQANSDVVMKNVLALIGCFNLDPNRVLDIILESFECRPERDDLFVPLMKQFITQQDTIGQLLGCKFQFYHGDNMETPESLLMVAARLIANGLVDLGLLYAHLSPSDKTIEEMFRKRMALARELAKKSSNVSLPDKNEPEKEPEPNPDDELLFIQKVGLVRALLRVGDWAHAKMLLDRLPDYFAISEPSVAAALCALVDAQVDQLYKKYSGIPSKIINKTRHETKGPKAEPVSSYQEFAERTAPMVVYLGPFLSSHPVLLVKLIRLAKTFFIRKADSKVYTADMEPVYLKFLTLFDEVILPSLSMLTANASVSIEIWNALKLLPYEIRFRLYGQWKNEAYNASDKMIRKRGEAIDRSKYIIKRLTKESVKQSGRQIGKISHCNPCVIFEYILSQIQRYDNLIGPVVDSLKFVTSLSYDVLAYCIIEALANPEREKLKYDDTNLSLWLQSLANFAGSIMKKYTIDMAGMLQYVANQLKAGKSYDLLILKEIVQKMCGIEVTEDMTDHQLESMAGGELLKQEANFAQVRNIRKSSSRLKDALLDHGLELPLCLLIAQQRDSVVFSEAGHDRHIKLTGILYDQCQDSLVQFCYFLANALGTEDYVKRFPHIDDLVNRYHLPPDAAFFLSRPRYQLAIQSKFDELRKQDKSNKNTSPEQKIRRYIEAVQSEMEPLIHVIKPLQPLKIWEDISPRFYVTFWTLTMFDLEVPDKGYDRQFDLMRLQNESDDSTANKKKKALKDKLEEERKRQVEHVARVKARLEHEKDQWFPQKSKAKNETIAELLQLCVFPRCLFTATDAVYCAKFINTIHYLRTPNFSTIIAYDRIFSDVSYSIASCSENEASRYGRFLCALLESVMRWHGDKNVYEQDCANYPGFLTVFRSSGSKSEQLDYENYRHVCHKWHFRLTKAFIVLFDSGDFVQIRNALIVLTKMLPHYPKIQSFANAIEKRLEKIKTEEKEKRADLYALAMGFIGQLRSRKESLVPESQFHQKDEKKASKMTLPTPKPVTNSTPILSKETNGAPAKDQADGNERANVTPKGSDENSKGTQRNDKDPRSTERVKTKRPSPITPHAASPPGFTVASSADNHEKRSDDKSKVRRSRSGSRERETKSKNNKEPKEAKEPKESKDSSSSRASSKESGKEGKESDKKTDRPAERNHGKENKDGKESKSPSHNHRRSTESSDAKRRRVEEESKKAAQEQPQRNPDKITAPERTERAERLERTERVDRMDRMDRMDRPDRIERKRGGGDEPAEVDMKKPRDDVKSNGDMAVRKEKMHAPGAANVGGNNSSAKKIPTRKVTTGADDKNVRRSQRERPKEDKR